MKQHIRQGLLLLTLLTLIITATACGRNNDQNPTDDTDTGNGMVAGASGQVVYAYIREINGQARTVTLDQVELVDQADAARVARLGLGDGDRMYKDFYIYNSRIQQRMYPLGDALVFDLADAEGTTTTNTTESDRNATESNSKDQSTIRTKDDQTTNSTGSETSPGLSSDPTAQNDQMNEQTINNQTQEPGDGLGHVPGLENGNGLGASSGGMAGVLELSDPDGDSIIGENEQNDHATSTTQSWPWLDSSYDNAVTSITKGIHAETQTLFAVTISDGEVIRISRMR